MKNKLQHIVCGIILLTGIAPSCGDPHRTPRRNPYSTTSPEVIDIHEVRSALPKTEGYETLTAYCIYCHSLRYIDMQPALTEDQWKHIVDKMTITYGAPVPDTAVEAIVRYLTGVKGNQ